MRHTTAVTFGAALLITATLAGCSDASESSPEPTSMSGQTPTSMASSSPGSETSTPVSQTSVVSEADLREPCAGVTSEDIEAVFGVDFGLPDDQTGAVSTVDDFNYKTVGCEFESMDEEIDVDVHLSFGEQFEDGAVHCIEPSGDLHPVTPINGLGNDAWWRSTEFANSTNAEGDVTVCLDAALLRIVAEGPAELRSTIEQQVIDVARKVVG